MACAICSHAFYIDCVDLTSSEARKINGKSGLLWNCVKCASLGSDLNSLKSLIVKLQDEISELRGLYRSPPIAQNSSTDTETIIREVCERQKRANNFIIYGSKEDASGSKDAAAAADADFVGSVLSEIDASAPVINITRLGKFDGSKSRPIKVMLSSPELVSKVIRSASKLKASKYRHLSLSFDRTPMQINLYKSVKEELSRRVAAGDKNLRIRYRNGIPTIQEN